MLKKLIPAALVAASVLIPSTLASASPVVPERGQSWSAAPVPERGQSWATVTEANKWSAVPATTTGDDCGPAAAWVPFYCGLSPRHLAAWLSGLTFVTPGEQALIGARPIGGYSTGPVMPPVK
jgi:hypothetical protein